MQRPWTSVNAERARGRGVAARLRARGVWWLLVGAGLALSGCKSGAIGGEKAVRALATAPDGKAFLVDACELERLGVATRDELLRGAPWPCQLLGAMTYVVLRDGGEPAAKTIARALML